MNAAGHFDVLVVGAGPAGSACATLLARAGLSVLLFDKEKFPRDKICGDCVNPLSWEYFELLGVADSLRSLNFHCIDSVRMTNLQGKEITIPVRSNRGRPFFSINRGTLDDLLARNAQREGATLLYQTRLLDATESDRWDVLVRSRGSLWQYSCNYLVGADGRNSTVAGKIRASDKTKTSRAARRRVGIQWHADVQPLVGSEVHLYKFESGYCGVVNLDDRTSNIAMVTDPQFAQLASTDFSRFLEKTVLSNPAGMRSCDDLTPVKDLSLTYPINPIVRRSGIPKAFLIGDARRTVEPFTGEGVCLSLQDGIRTSQKILRAFDKGRGGAPIPVRRSFWVNRVYSPVLRNHQMAESVVSTVARYPVLSRLLGRTVFGAQVQSAHARK